MRAFPFESQNIGTEAAPVWDRPVSAEELRTINMMRWTNGVFRSPTTKDYQTSMQVIGTDEMAVTVKAGGVMINGAMKAFDETTIEIAAADTRNARVDRIVARFNNSISARDIELAVLTGVAATNPQPPAVTAQANYFELVLADIRVSANAVAVTNDNIADKRNDVTLCGWVKPVLPPELNTAALYLQNKEGIVPKAEDMVVVPDYGYDGMATVAIPGAPALQPENIRLGVDIFGVVGEYTGLNDNFIKYVERQGTDLVLPDGLTKIASRGCQSWNELLSVVIPDSVEEISDFAFYYCENVDIEKMPAELTKIGESAFVHCFKLSSPEFGGKLEKIGKSAFSNCTELELTELPDSITSIADSAFFGCTKLALTKLPPLLTVLNISAFSGCTALAISEIPEGVTNIYNTVFENCTSITEITIPASVTQMLNAFQRCTGLKKITFKGKPTTLNSYAFRYCTQNGLVINVPWAEGEVSGAPWGATNAIINYGVEE